MIEKNITITNKLGLHARAASKLVNCASSFASDVRLRREDREVNGKSIMGVLMLAAAKGTVLIIRVEGDDEQQAAEDLEHLFETNFGEDE